MNSLINGTTKEQNIIWGVRFEQDKMFIGFVDGTELSVPLAWFPKLYYATPLQLSHWRVVGRGLHIRWTELDEDIYVGDLVR